MPTTSPKTLTLIAASLALISTAAMPMAASAGTSQNVAVKIDRADLNSDAGAQRVIRRLQNSAENACQANEGPTNIKHRISADRCVDRLMKSFTEQVNNERLRAAYAATLKQSG